MTGSIEMEHPQNGIAGKRKIVKRLLYLLCILVCFVSACNLPAAEGTDPQIATAAALTVQAALSATPPTSPVTGASSTSPAFSQPLITVDDVTNCRTGPGTNYERVVQIAAGQQVEIVGVYPPGYWIVSTNAGICWVSAEFATPMGSVQAVPTVTAPPTPEGNVPAGVSFQQWDIFCNFQTGQADISIRWSDKGDDEAGYRVIRNGTVIAEFPPNTTQYSETIALLSGQSVSYRVESFNEVGTSSSATLPLAC
jgi:uncharacterized protein YraI